MDFEDVAEDDVTFGVASEFLRAKRRQRKSENLHEEEEEEGEEEKEEEGEGGGARLNIAWHLLSYSLITVTNIAASWYARRPKQKRKLEYYLDQMCHCKKKIT